MAVLDLKSANIIVKLGDKEHTLDLMECQVFLDEKVSGKPSEEFVPAIQQFFQEKTGVQLSFSQCYAFADNVWLSYQEFKKKYDSELRSAFPTVSIPSTSPTESTSSSETNYQDSEPSNS